MFSWGLIGLYFIALSCSWRAWHEDLTEDDPEDDELIFASLGGNFFEGLSDDGDPYVEGIFSTSKIDSPLILLHCSDGNKRCGQTFQGFCHSSQREVRHILFQCDLLQTTTSTVVANITSTGLSAARSLWSLDHWVTTAAFTRVKAPHISVNSAGSSCGITFRTLPISYTGRVDTRWLFVPSNLWSVPYKIIDVVNGIWRRCQASVSQCMIFMNSRSSASTRTQWLPPFWGPPMTIDWFALPLSHIQSKNQPL